MRATTTIDAGNESAANRTATAARVDDFYDLTLFVSGASDLGARAINDAGRLCEAYLPGRYRLTVVDVHDNADLFGAGVFATPTLVKNRPAPRRRVVGEFADAERVLRKLGLPTVRVTAQAT